MKSAYWILAFSAATLTSACGSTKSMFESSTSGRQEDAEKDAGSTGGFSLTQPDLKMELDSLKVLVSRSLDGGIESREIRKTYSPGEIIAVAGLKPGKWQIDVSVERAGKAVKKGSTSVQISSGTKSKAVVSLKSTSGDGDLDIQIEDGDVKGDACAQLSRMESQPQPLLCRMGKFVCQYPKRFDVPDEAATGVPSVSAGSGQTPCEANAQGACGRGIPPRPSDIPVQPVPSNVLTATSSCSDFEARLQILRTLCQRHEVFRPDQLSCSNEMPIPMPPEPMPFPGPKVGANQP